ncbi:MAG: TetR/AcrR family transcriptional regulator [Lachnospiraceae bacterium]
MQKSDLTRQKIKEVYVQNIEFTKWDKITVKQICESASITRGTFYQYFNDIYDLMEQIETPLVKEIEEKYKIASRKLAKAYLPQHFEEHFDYSPPGILLTWFDFCQCHREEMAILLGSNGDPYFTSKLKIIIKEQISTMMDQDGMPNDELRSHFSKIFLELHFMAAKTWLSSDEDSFLPIESIINLLNTMRVGANYLTYRRLTSPDFDMKMKIPSDE